MPHPGSPGSETGARATPGGGATARTEGGGRVGEIGRGITRFLESFLGPATGPSVVFGPPEALGPGGEGRGGSIFGRGRRRAVTAPRFSEAELAAEKARRDLLRLAAAQGRGSTAFASDRRVLAAARADPGSALFNGTAS